MVHYRWADGRTDGQTNGGMDGSTDGKVTYRGGCLT